MKSSSKPRLRTFLAYLGVGAIQLTLFFPFTGSRPADWKHPQAWQQDPVLTMVLMNGLADGEWRPFGLPKTDRLGAPFGMTFGDYPVPETTHYGLIQVLSLISPDPVHIHNLFYIAGFFFIPILFFFLCRRYGISGWVAFCASALFNFQLYHHARFGHILLASYFAIPLFLWAVIEVSSENPPFAKPLKAWGKLEAGIILALFFATGGGIYYAFFAFVFCALFMVAASMARLSAKPLISGTVTLAVLGLGLMIHMAPFVSHQLKHGKNPMVATRHHGDAELNGVKLITMVLPSDHKIEAWRKKAAKYNPLFRQNESAGPIGLVASLGLMGLIAGFIFWRGKISSFGFLERLSVLLGVTLFYTMIGGFAIFFSTMISPSIRGIGRVSIWIAAICLLAVAYGFDRWIYRRYSKLWVLPLLFAVTAFGVWEQQPYYLTVGQPQLRKNYESDVEFYREAERRSAPGTQVLALPYMSFPETLPVGGMSDYSHAKGYLLTDTLKFSYGAMRDRPEDRQISRWSRLPLNFDEIRKAGYQAVLFEPIGMSDRPKTEVDELRKSLEKQSVQPPLASPLGDKFFYWIGGAK